jgi:hypothetical protein
MQMKEPGRNDKCPCRSGLKYKRCHGDGQLAQNANRVAKFFVTMNIARRAYDAELVTGSEYEKGTGMMIKAFNDLLPDGLEISMTEVVEVEDMPDKLEEKEKAGQTLDDIQKGMEPCPTCGVRLPAGMQCAKPQCKPTY